MSTLVTQFLELLFIVHDEAGYHLRLWGFRTGRHGSQLRPTIPFGLAVLITMIIGIITVPLIFNYLQTPVYDYLNVLNWKLPALFVAEFSFTLFWLLHFVKRKVIWDKWKAGSLILAILFFVIFTAGVFQ
jgi:hypothetical protein